STSDQKSLSTLDSGPSSPPASTLLSVWNVYSWYARASIQASATRSVVAAVVSSRFDHRSTRAATVARYRPGLRSDNPRSLLAVVIATLQPLSTSPMTSLSGTNTFSRKISAKPGSPSSCGTGRHWPTAAPLPTMREVSPRCVPASGAVPNNPPARPANAARELQPVWPDNSHPPSVPTALPVSAAMSLPASASDQACAQ